LLSSFARIDARPFDRVSLSDWVRERFGNGNLAGMLHALFRLTSYVNEPDRMSAGAAIRQLQLGLVGNVWYLDGGWQTLISGLRATTSASGAEIRTNAKVESVKSDADGITVRLSGGETLHSRAVILAVPPSAVADLLQLSANDPLARQLSSCVSVRAACLDLALSHLPRPAHRFVLGMDKPLYYSLHSASARLAPRGVAVIQMMKYLGASTTSSEAVEHEMENLLDLLQPGWRDHVMTKRFLPNMVVVHDLPRADTGGLSGRVGIIVRDNVYLAGDWVGDEAMLADASVASAAEASRRVLAAVAGGSARSERSPSHVNN
jgi:phytoene dehydrogenase-like protein